MDETKRTRLINLSRKENRYCYEFYGNIFYMKETKKIFKKFIERTKKKHGITSFVNQYLTANKK